LLALAVYLWFRHNQKVVLPEPTGPYKVGRMEFDWTDPNRLEPFAIGKREHRELMVWVWYPTDSTPSASKPVEYLPTGWRKAREKDMGTAAIFFAQNLATIEAHAYPDVPLSGSEQTYPIIIMQPGLGPIASDYTILAEDLASHGYIVFASTPTYSSSVAVFNDGRVALTSSDATVLDNMTPEEVQIKLGQLVGIWAQDNIFIMDKLDKLNTYDPGGIFTGRLDLELIGMMGHSFGGASAVETCSLDLRCKAGVNLDGTIYGDVVKKGLMQPFLFLWNESSYDSPTILSVNETVQVSKVRIYQFYIKGMRHFNFSDYGVEYQPVMHWMGALGPINGKRGLRIASAYIHAFFDLELRHISTTLLEGPSSKYPEVRIGLPPSP